MMTAREKEGRSEAAKARALKEDLSEVKANPAEDDHPSDRRKERVSENHTGRDRNAPKGGLSLVQVNGAVREGPSGETTHRAKADPLSPDAAGHSVKGRKAEAGRDRIVKQKEK